MGIKYYTYYKYIILYVGVRQDGTKERIWIRIIAVIMWLGRDK